MGASADSMGLYVHLPFCRQRCIYCDFPTQIGSSQDLVGYLPVLDAELALYGDQPLEAMSLFFGGGTPSLLTGEQFAALMATIRSRMTLAPGIEITLEANPGTVTAETLLAYREAGLNRLSLGAQTFNAQLLTTLNRLHGPEAIGEAIAMARGAGLTNLNIDLIYGLPGQTMADWQDTIEQALALDLPHHSLYPLTVESGTPLDVLVSKGKLNPLGEDDVFAMYEWAKARLESVGYRHYEIANFARPGFEAQHNLVYWRNLPYIGLGMGAHSHFNGRRYGNPATLHTYTDRVLAGSKPWQEDEALSRDDEIEETVFLGLRLLDEGLDPTRFAARFGEDFGERYAEVLAKLTADELIHRGEDGRWLLTRGAVPVAHEVFVHFMQEQD
ncbi:MAG: radical SAM family heme chaperone HemW [Candidatus Sericytochromatia bacterium]|nr:radical SAM family heme chaperone HemW [Candidatus Sericytochromatia bacterium]